MSKNSWINHVKAYAKEHNLTYNCAISHAKSTYMRFQDQSFPGPRTWLFRLWACGARSACPLYEPRVLILPDVTV